MCSRRFGRRGAGIWKKASVHTLRHTFGAHKADKHMSLATLQELMGHKKKETTLTYIHLAKTNLGQEMVQTALYAPPLSFTSCPN